MANIGKESRNPFTMLLLQSFIENEAMHVFGEGRKNLIKYLSIPPDRLQTSIADIRSFRWKSADEKESAIQKASSTVGKVIQRIKVFKFSDDMLNRIVQRLTFYCNVRSFVDFELEYSKWSKEFDSYIGSKIDNATLAEIADCVSSLYRSETIYLRQINAWQSGRRENGIVRLKEDLILKIVNRNQTELQEWRMADKRVSYVPKIKFQKINIDEKHTVFAIFDERMRIIGDIAHIPIKIPELNKISSLSDLETQIDFPSFADISINTIFVSEVSAIKRSIYLTLVSRFSLIFSHMQSIMDSYLDNDELRVLIIQKEDSFDLPAQILGFSKIENNYNEGWNSIENIDINQREIVIEDKDRAALYHTTTTLLINNAEKESLGIDLF